MVPSRAGEQPGGAASLFQRLPGRDPSDHAGLQRPASRRPGAAGAIHLGRRQRQSARSDGGVPGVETRPDTGGNREVVPSTTRRSPARTRGPLAARRPGHQPGRHTAAAGGHLHSVQPARGRQPGASGNRIRHGHRRHRPARQPGPGAPAHCRGTAPGGGADRNAGPSGVDPARRNRAGMGDRTQPAPRSVRHQLPAAVRQ